jgi:hypothetical protein
MKRGVGQTRLPLQHDKRVRSNPDCETPDCETEVPLALTNAQRRGSESRTSNLIDWLRHGLTPAPARLTGKLNRFIYCIYVAYYQ